VDLLTEKDYAMTFTSGTTDITASTLESAAQVYANMKMGNIGCPDPVHVSTDGNVHTFMLSHALWGAITKERTFILIEESR
jgi:hypothetical protein